MSEEPSNSPSTDTNQPSASPQKIDIADILKANLDAQQTNEAPVDFQRLKSRKTRDYWVCMCVVNLFLMVLPSLLLEVNVVSVVSSLAGMIVFSSGFSWIMWQVISDY